MSFPFLPLSLVTTTLGLEFASTDKQRQEILRRTSSLEGTGSGETKKRESCAISDVLNGERIGVGCYQIKKRGQHHNKKKNWGVINNVKPGKYLPKKVRQIMIKTASLVK